MIQLPRLPRLPRLPKLMTIGKHSHFGDASPLSVLICCSFKVTVISHIAPHLTKKKMHTSILTGEAWVQELLKGFFWLHVVQNSEVVSYRTSSLFSKDDGNEPICLSEACPRIKNKNMALSNKISKLGRTSCNLSLYCMHWARKY